MVALSPSCRAVVVAKRWWNISMLSTGKRSVEKAEVFSWIGFPERDDSLQRQDFTTGRIPPKPKARALRQECMYRNRER
jgi:hypothetical protein